ncbi:cytochrome P450 4C1-like [Planococcus citri]|uniref:cytochrome P450 4C1-like n=1 Tax=Planococcus citri TaxID=170843 RepID=UPI0031F8A70C
MNVIQISACAIIIVLLIKYLRKPKDKRFYELLERFPSYRKYLLIGNANMLFGPLDDVRARFENIFKLHHRVLFWLGPTPCLLLKKYDDIATILIQSSHRDFLGAGDEWLGTSILSGPYEEWKKSIKMLGPAFSPKMLTKYEEVFKSNSLELVEKLKPVANSGKEFDVWELMMKATLDVVTETSFGVSIKTSGRIGEQFCTAVHDTIELIMKRIQFPWLMLTHINWLYLIMIGKTDSIHNFQHYPTTVLRKSIEDYQNSRRDNDAFDQVDKSKAVIDSLVRYSFKEPDVTETRMRDELLGLMGASVETSPLNTSFIMLMMAMHQDIQQKVYEEISKFETDDGILTQHDIYNNMPYLEQCIKESLRMFSPVALTNRRIHKDIVLKDGMIVPKNTFVVTFITFANYDPDLYKNPDKYDPEHFTEEAIKARPKISDLSLGVGPRPCIGGKYAMMFNKTQMAYILLNYHISTRVKEFTKDHLNMGLGIKSKIGYPLIFTSRR